MNDPYEQFATFARTWSPRITEAELAEARHVFRPARAAKGEYLARPGESATGSAFILRGLVRKVFIGADGRERVNGFGAEGSLVCPYRAALLSQVSDLAIQTLEPTWYLAVPPGAFGALVERYPGWRELVARQTEQKFVEAEIRNRTLLLDDATERYQSFLADSPLAERIPLVHVAGFIGVTPEALSRIRRRILVSP